MNRKGNFLSQEEVKEMIKLSTPSNFRLGKEIFDKGEIEIIEWKCSCGRTQKKFCKHAVALGLEITK